MPGVTYIPDPRDYQQIRLGGITGPVDCTGWGGAFRVDAHTKGQIKTTGRALRLNSDEPVPDKNSPGLTLGQVDEAIIKVTHGRVDLDTRAQGRAISRKEATFLIKDGRFMGASLRRGVLVDRGFVHGFSGSHDATFFVRDTEPDQLLMFDSLVPYIVRVSWDAAFDACESLTGIGQIYAQFTRDLTPDYHVRIPYGQEFAQFFLDANGKITRVVKHISRNAHWQRCSTPRYHGSAPGKPQGWARFLVEITDPGQKRDGWLVDHRYAKEIIP